MSTSIAYGTDSRGKRWWLDFASGSGNMRLYVDNTGDGGECRENQALLFSGSLDLLRLAQGIVLAFNEQMRNEGEDEWDYP